MKETLMKKKFNEFVYEISTGICTISLEKNRRGEFICSSQGSRISTLLTLATAEREILQKLNCDKEEFEEIKKIVKFLGERYE